MVSFVIVRRSRATVVRIRPGPNNNAIAEIFGRAHCKRIVTGRLRTRRELREHLVPGAGVEPARSKLRGIFLPATAYTAAHSRICGLDFTFALRVSPRIRQGPSSLYTFHAASPHGLARDCRFTRNSGFPEFDPIHTSRFRAGCSNTSSPLCLPVSPPGQDAGGTHHNRTVLGHKATCRRSAH